MMWLISEQANGGSRAFGWWLPALLFLTAAAARADIVEAVPSNDTVTIALPAMPSGSTTVHLYVADADYADEGFMTINGHQVELFGTAAAAANTETITWTAHVVPASFWQAGANTIKFSYARRANSFRVDIVRVEYQPPGDMPVVLAFKVFGYAPAWLDGNDEMLVRLRRNPDRIYVCTRENGAANGRTWTAWWPGGQLITDFSQPPPAPIDNCDRAICFAKDDATSSRDNKIAQTCGSAH